MNQFNGNLPILGQAAVKPRMAPGAPGGLVRRLDKDGTYEPEGIRAVDAQQSQIIIGRENIVSAEDLVEMMREMVREELRRYLDKVTITTNLGRIGHLGKLIEDGTTLSPDAFLRAIETPRKDGEA